MPTQTRGILVIINAKRVWCGGPLRSGSTQHNSDAVLVIGNRIHAVGLSEDMLQLATRAAQEQKDSAMRIIDCRSQFMVLPGFVDSHVHLLDGGKRLFSVDLRNCRGKRELGAAVQAFIADNHIQPGGWITGGDWSDVLLGEMPDKHWIDEFSKDYFVLLTRLDSHCAFVNSKVIEVCPELADPTFSVEGGTICRDSVTGEATGLLKERAIEYVKKRLWPATETPERMQAGLHHAGRYLTERGITFVHSMSSLDYGNIGEINFLRSVERKTGKLPVRVRTAIRVEELDEFLTTCPRVGGDDNVVCDTNLTTCKYGSSGFLRLGMVKFFSDGSLGSRTAAMKEPYNGTCQCGYFRQEPEVLQAGIEKTIAAGLQCCIHAIGDAAVDFCVKCVSESMKKHANVGSRRHRIEHCQHVHDVPSLARQMAEANIIASCQPCHLLFDGDYVEELIGTERKNTTYVFRSLMNHGVHVCFGSDWMVAPADVNDGLRAAVLRVPDAQLEKNRTVWNPAETLSIEEALRGFTYAGAVAGFAEHELGSLEPGFLADVVILSDDLLLADGNSSVDMETMLRSVSVMFTILDGEVVFERT